MADGAQSRPDTDGEEPGTFPDRSGNRLELLINGCEIFPRMLAAMREARDHISFETFIYWSGAIAEEFADTLAERARNGVTVRVVLDWLGCRKMSDRLIRRMHEAGVRIRHHRPLHWFNLRRANHRTHRKILVIDGRIGFIGGVGIADVWDGNARGPDEWRDNHYRIEGPVVGDLQRLFFDHWREDDRPPAGDSRYYPSLEPAGSSSVRLVAGEPIHGPNRIRDLYLELIGKATDRLLITSPYFVPGDRVLWELCRAAARGVRIEVITAGEHNDRKIVRAASRHEWGPLFEAGVRLFEYHPTMIHTKLLIVDDATQVIGSANFDVRSTQLNEEGNLLIKDEDLVRDHEASFARDRSVAAEVHPARWRNRPWHLKQIDSAAHLLRPML